LHDKIAFKYEVGGKIPPPEEFVKVPFKESTSLVAKRMVFLYKGYSYVHVKDLHSIASSQFRTQLNKNMVEAYKHFP
jgi:DNA primase large subunit